jgi:hypothetical protein
VPFPEQTCAHASGIGQVPTSLKNELDQDGPEYPQSEFTQEIGGQMKDIKIEPYNGQVLENL